MQRKKETTFKQNKLYYNLKNLNRMIKQVLRGEAPYTSLKVRVFF